jgi:hypothetical protein
MAALPAEWDAPLMRTYGRVCDAWARVDLCSMPQSKPATSARVFDRALAEFAGNYADQNLSAHSFSEICGVATVEQHGTKVLCHRTLSSCEHEARRVT